MYFRYIFKCFLMLVAIFSVGCKESKDNNSLKWTSVNVCTPKPQGDAHVITKNGKTVIIDGGEYYQGKNNLISFLKRNHIAIIDELLITHPHFDHYGGILAILEDNSFIIKKLYMNMPTKEQMEKEWWSGKYKDLIQIRKVAKKRSIPIYKIKQGDIFWFDKNSYLKVLYIYDLNNTPVKNITINDMSAVTMLYDYNHRYLLTGDLDKNIGAYLALHAKDLKADILKVPHHGVTTLPPNSFFDKVDAKYFIITAPDYFWNNPEWKRSDRVKKYVKKHNITTYISGIDGDITVISNKSGFYIKTSPPKITTVSFDMKIVNTQTSRNILQLFYSNNSKYSEENSKRYYIKDTKKVIHYKIKLYQKPTKYIRIDPINSKGRVVISNLTINNSGKEELIDLTKIGKLSNIEIISQSKNQIEFKALTRDPNFEIINSYLH